MKAAHTIWDWRIDQMQDTANTNTASLYNGQVHKTAQSLIADQQNIVGEDMPTIKRGRPAKQMSGPKIQIPQGYASVVDFIRLGIEMEKAGASVKEIAKKFSIGTDSYCLARDVVLLSERSDLSRRDLRHVKRALAFLNTYRQVRQFTATIKPIANRVWGRHGHRMNADKKRIEKFTSAISFINSTCGISDEISIPSLSDEQRTEALIEIKLAVQALRDLEERIKQGAKL
jgi:hypothetical protein